MMEDEYFFIFLRIFFSVKMKKRNLRIAKAGAVVGDQSGFFCKKDLKRGAFCAIIEWKKGEKRNTIATKLKK